jgi:flavin reductase (DIM6/NTAB) family NADH-FMN oxidoreductase RutF
MDKNGKPNLAPYSFFNAVGSNPATVIFSPALSGREAKTKDTLANIRETGEAVVNIVHFGMVQQMSLASSPYPKGVNEFEKAGFTQVASELVQPFRVGESFVQMECKIKDIIVTGELGGAGNIVIAEVVMMHIDEQALDADGKIDPYKMNYVARMGGNYYCRVLPESIFELKQPKDTTGLGVDKLPVHIRNSKTLTGNHLGALGNFVVHPSSEEIAIFLNDNQDISEQAEQVGKEQIAMGLLNNGKTWEAFCLLMS